MINLTFVIAGHTPGAPHPDIYKKAANRFADTYKKYPAGFEHKLFLIDSNDGLTPAVATIFENIPHEVIKYRGSGWDIGAHQFAALCMSPEDWLMGFSSWAHFRQAGWLRAFADARNLHGDGLYGSTSSFERFVHIRTTGFFIRCERVHRYPYGCNSKEESLAWEHAPHSISQWCIQQGYGAWLVTPEATVTLENSRELDNVFRRGDQSNIWTYDKHTDLFDEASPEEKIKLAYRADGHKRRRGFKKRLWQIQNKMNSIKGALLKLGR